MRRLSLPAFLLALTLAACAPAPATDPVPGLVAATLTALPTPTPPPTSTPVSTPTPFSLEGLFCEYEFCIGHPPGLTLYDADAARDQRQPGTYAGGRLAGYSQAQNLFLLIAWQQGEGNEQQLLETLAASMGDTLTGSLQVKLHGPLNVFIQEITPTPQSTLRSGLAAAWRCSDRLFVWKLYTDSPERARLLLDQALSRFRCSPR